MISGTVIPIILINIIHDIASIPCNFQYTEHHTTYPYGEELERLDLELENHSSDINTFHNFSCEENDLLLRPRIRTLDIKEEISKTSPKSTTVDNSEDRSDDSNEYEEVETSCSVRKRTIQPKALNNIYNRLTKVVNTDSFVQSIHIEECLNTREPCNQGFVTLQKDKKYICRQKFVRITLKALSEKNSVYDDLFYYPSHCVCELVTVKKKAKVLRTTKRRFFSKI